MNANAVGHVGLVFARIARLAPSSVREAAFAVAFPRGKKTSVGGDVFRIDPKLRRIGEVEPAAWEAFVGEIREGDTVVDVGANWGAYTLAAARRGAKVIAIDPDPRNIEQINRHVARNGFTESVTVVPVAAAAENAAIPFYFHPRSTHSRGVDLHVRNSGDFVVVPSVTLDSLVGRFPRVDVLKIDVEGMEGAVLAGARKLFADTARRPRLVLVEVHPEALARLETDWETLRDAVPGYDWSQIDEHDQPHWVAVPRVETEAPST